MSAAGEGPREQQPARPQAYLLAPIESKHEQASRDLILRAAQMVQTPSPRAVLVLGAGPCDEIPLAELAARFERVTLNDIDAERLERGIAGANLSTAERDKITSVIGDLTGTTEPLLAAIREALSQVGSETAEEAVRRMAEVVGPWQPAGLSLEGQFDLVVASCLLSQLHVGVAHGAAKLFEARFAGQADLLRKDRHWHGAMHALARAMERRFLDDLTRLVADGGLIYLSESVQMCYVELTAEGQWKSAGTLRMLRTTNLADYLDARFTMLDRRRWEWVVLPPQAVGQVGRLFDVQAIVLRVRSV